jgi:hypothetical protein
MGPPSAGAAGEAKTIIFFNEFGSNLQPSHLKPTQIMSFDFPFVRLFGVR